MTTPKTTHLPGSTVRVEKDVRPSKLANLDVFIGRWITEGETAPDSGGSSTPMRAMSMSGHRAGDLCSIRHTGGLMTLTLAALRLLVSIPRAVSFQRTFSMVKATYQHKGSRSNAYSSSGLAARASTLYYRRHTDRAWPTLVFRRSELSSTSVHARDWRDRFRLRYCFCLNRREPS
jgi:hypothetical protein